MLPGAKKDPQLITSSWTKLQTVIEGVGVREVRHVPGNKGILTEIFRPEWDPTPMPVGQVFQVCLLPGAISAWHAHMKTTDRIFANGGLIKVVLYDSRKESRTYGVINEFHVGQARPTLLIIPPNVWHGVQNLQNEESLILNFPTQAYEYEDPDHYRLPFDTLEIPYSWSDLRA